jgi:hypothetical protein
VAGSSLGTGIVLGRNNGRLKQVNGSDLGISIRTSAASVCGSQMPMMA